MSTKAKQRQNRAVRAMVRRSNINPSTVRERDGNRCYMCGRETTDHSVKTIKDGTARVIEHVVPVSLGGEDTMYNVRIACRGCDQRKANNAERVNIFALLPQFLDYPVQEHPYVPVPAPKQSKPKQVDGWWNYEDLPPLRHRPRSGPLPYIQVSAITSRDELKKWWDRNK